MIRGFKHQLVSEFVILVLDHVISALLSSASTGAGIMIHTTRNC